MSLDTSSSTTLRYRRNKNRPPSPRSLGRKNSRDNCGNVSTDLAGTDGSVTDTLTEDEVVDNDRKNTPQVQNKAKFEKMIRRTKLAFFMLFLFCLIVSLGHIWVVMTVWVLQALAFRELTNLRYKVSLCR
jgi:hypothetical protein